MDKIVLFRKKIQSSNTDLGTSLLMLKNSYGKVAFFRNKDKG